LADSYVPASSVTAAAAAEAAASRKEVKYSDLPASFSFQPIAVETLHGRTSRGARGAAAPPPKKKIVQFIFLGNDKNLGRRGIVT